jgi:tetratricopeptide (TPR) repeat protein
VWAWVALAGVAHAQRPDPDTQAARRHYDRGLKLYDQEHYEEAAREFQTAKEMRPTPAFDYNIGRCYERLERWKDAADAYDRFLAGTPAAEDTAALRTRVAVLRERERKLHGGPERAPPPIVTTPPPVVSAPPARSERTTVAVTVMARPLARPIYKRAWFWGAVAGGVVVVALAVGLGVGLSSGGGGDASHPIMGVKF